MRGLATGVALGLLLLGLEADANESLSNTNIFLDIRTDNAAIDTLTSFGFDNFNPGTPVSDWGVMLDGSPSTFQLNTTNQAIASIGGVGLLFPEDESEKVAMIEQTRSKLALVLNAATTTAPNSNDNATLATDPSFALNAMRLAMSIALRQEMPAEIRTELTQQIGRAHV